MNLKSIKNAVYTHRGSILTVAKAASFILAVYFSAKDTPRAMKAIDEAELDKCIEYKEKHSEDTTCSGFPGLTRIEKIRYGAPKYWRTGICAGATIGLDIITAKMMGKQLQSYKLLATMALNDKDKLIKAVEETVSKDKLNKIKTQIAQEDINNNPPKIDTSFADDGTHTFRIFGSDFRSTRNDVDAKFNEINSQICQGEVYSRNHLRNLFGLDDEKGVGNLMYGRNAGMPGDIIKYDVVPAQDIYGNPICIIDIRNQPEVW